MKENKPIKAVNPIVVGTKEDGGFVGFDACDELCSHCMCETYNIPVDAVSLCSHCGAELLPCATCEDSYCDFDMAKGGCHRFQYSDNYIAKQKARMMDKEVPLFIGDDVYVKTTHYTGKAKIVGTADDEYDNFPDVKAGAYDDCFIVDCGEDVGTMTVHKSEMETFYIHVENNGFPIQPSELILEVPFVSVWDGGVEVETQCRVNIKTGEVHAIEKSGLRGMAYVRGLDVCEEQYIVMNDEKVIVYEDENGFDYWADLKGIDVTANPSIDFTNKDNSSSVVNISITVDGVNHRVTANSVNEAIGGFLVDNPDLCYNELQVDLGEDE